jgi:hypothetical protein
MHRSGEITGLAPLFDHGMSLHNGYDDMLDYCMVPWEQGQPELKHFDMFEKLAQDYPDQIGRLLDKCKNIELGEFAAGRCVKMNEIYERVKQNTGKNTEVQTPVKPPPRKSLKPKGSPQVATRPVESTSVQQVQNDEPTPAVPDEPVAPTSAVVTKKPASVITPIGNAPDSQSGFETVAGMRVPVADTTEGNSNSGPKGPWE